MGDAPSYELAYRAGIEVLQEQATTLRETRDRVGALLSAAAVAGGLAAGLAANSGLGPAVGRVGWIGVAVAVVGFVGVTVSAVAIWWPVDMRLGQDAGVIIGSYIEGDPPMALPEVHRELALWLGQYAAENRDGLALQLRTYAVGLVCLLIELAGIVIALGSVAHG